MFGTLVDFELEREERPLVAKLLAEADEQANPDQVLSTWVQASLAERARTPFRTVRVSLEHGAHLVQRRHELAIDPSRWASALETLWSTRPLHEHTRPVLDLLDQASVPHAVVSNVDEPVLGALLRRTGLGKRTNVVVSSHRARAYKPHPRAFQMALASLDVDPRQAIHVGDNPAEDRAGAKAAGMRARIIDPGEEDLLDVITELIEG